MNTAAKDESHGLVEPEKVEFLTLRHVAEEVEAWQLTRAEFKTDEGLGEEKSLHLFFAPSEIPHRQHRYYLAPEIKADTGKRGKPYR